MTFCNGASASLGSCLAGRFITSFANGLEGARAGRLSGGPKGTSALSGALGLHPCFALAAAGMQRCCLRAGVPGKDQFGEQTCDAPLRGFSGVLQIVFTFFGVFSLSTGSTAVVDA